jgi:ubiquinone/menaquinone biosynthesis C-methylase UbiE
MPEIATDNLGYVECWNEILTPKWVRFRHLLSGNGKLHSDVADVAFDIQKGDKVLDVACGFGETSLALGRKIGPEGEVLGIDCTDAFMEIAERELQEAGADNVRYQHADAMIADLPQDYFDVAYVRFGMMNFQSPVRAMRNIHGALKPGGKLCMIVWRSLADNPCWRTAKEVALQLLPPTGEQAVTCGPGPFSMAGEESDRAMLEAGGFPNVDVFQQIDVDIRLGRDVEEAVDYQLLVGPAGEIIREAGEEGQRQLPAIREALHAAFDPHLREDGVFMPSSTWAIMARK